MNRIVFSHNKDSWETPDWLFGALNYNLHFTLDAAASDENHLCKRYFTELNDALKCEWNNETVFVNPPYSKWQKFVAKAYEQWKEYKITICMLLPARTDTKAFHKYIWDMEKGCPKEGISVVFWNKRIKFLLNGKEILDKHGRPQSATFPSMIVTFYGDKK